MKKIIGYKWFYKPQQEADEELRKQYQHVTTIYQVIDKVRVVNQMKCWNETDENRTDILQVITKQGSRASVLIYVLTYKQGWPVD